MSVDWNAFSPGPALAGGVLIGLASALYVLANGRIAGIAGVVGTAWQALRRGKGHLLQGERWLFILGLVLAPWLWQLVRPLPAAQMVASPLLVAVAGLLVGVGVRMGNGCTSGHGVCGLSRLSLRSLANVLAFMGAGFVTVALVRHVL
jgi:uncharacterized protein